MHASDPTLKYLLNVSKINYANSILLAEINLKRLEDLSKIENKQALIIIHLYSD